MTKRVFPWERQKRSVEQTPAQPSLSIAVQQATTEVQRLSTDVQTLLQCKQKEVMSLRHQLHQSKQQTERQHHYIMQLQCDLDVCISTITQFCEAKTLRQIKKVKSRVPDVHGDLTLH